MLEENLLSKMPAQCGHGVDFVRLLVSNRTMKNRCRKDVQVSWVPGLQVVATGFELVLIMACSVHSDCLQLSVACLIIMNK